MTFSEAQKSIFQKGFILMMIAPLLVGVSPAAVTPEQPEQRMAGLGIIKGIVRDDVGSPIADATVAIFRLGTSKLLKQVKSASDGSFVAKVLPGTYTVLAVAQGFNPVTLSEVEISGQAAMTYRFKLERAGGGNTLPEKRLDRNNPKWVIRSAQTSRSIYQNTEGGAPDVTETAAKTDDAAVDEHGADRPGQTVVESYFAGSKAGNYSGVNFATLIPLSDDSEVVLVGQIGTGAAPQRLETQFKFRPSDDHQIRLSGSVGRLGFVSGEGTHKALGQVSLQGTDEWKVREGVILVLGVDYARFIGAGSDYSLSPRIGFQFDVDSKTRLRSSFTTQTESRTWSRAIELEDSQILFRDPVAVEDLVVEGNAPKMNRSSRLEFGIERVLDNRSSVDAKFFLDTTYARGIGMSVTPFDSIGDLTEFTANQRGAAQGVTLVYSRRLSSKFSAAAGYSFGRGQSLSGEALSDPSALFHVDLFQSLFGQFEADLKTGTTVKTIFRLSPAATVFAIDPFQGRLAIYDPGLSVLVTQNVPTFGLPFRAEAIVDARNLFDFQSGVNGEDGSLRLNSQRRMLRGSILVRF
ncbi:MAG: TonB-dependent receptor [Acidobacteriota bacterium]